MPEAVTDGPLAGLRVLDLGHYYAGPMAAMLLADQGADVVRVMRPEGPELPAPQHRVLNRNKRLLELDLATSEGREHARALALRADVVIESFRPGVMARHGLDRASLAQENPGLVTLSLPGFASSDTERASLQAWEGVVAAAASLFDTELRRHLNFPPLPIPAPICSAFGSLHGAIAVVAALVARERGHAGTHIEVPLVNAGLSTCTRTFVYDGGRLRVEPNGSSELPSAVAALALDPDDDEATRREKAAGLGALAPPIFTTHPYTSADGRRLMLMPIKPEMAERFFTILGLMVQLRSEGFVIESPWERIDLGSGNNLASSWTLTRENSLRVIECVQERIAREPADHWQATFAAAGIPVAYLRTREEWMRDPHVEAAGLIAPMNDGSTTIRASGTIADVTNRDGERPRFAAREPESVRHEAIATLFGEAEAKSPSTRTPDRREAREPTRKSDLLSGVRVLDLCNVVAGPNAAYTLAQFGADVVRVEPPKSFNLPMHLEWTLEVNQGKRSVILDLGTTPGREAFARLVRWADIVVHNRLDDVAERLGMTAAQLQAINSDVVVCQNSAFGGSIASAWDAVPGYDPMPNLATGLDAAAGSPEAPRAMTEIFADLMGGLGTGFASVLGLYQRETTGVAGAGRSSLVRGAHHYQLTELIDSGGTSLSDADRRDANEIWWQRLYACRDRWIFVGARSDRRAALAHVVTGREDADAEALENAIREKDASHWLELFAEHDIGCHRVLNLGELLDDPRPVDNDAADELAGGALEILRWDEHPSGLPLLLPAPAWVLIGTDRSYRRLQPTARVGAHTRDVLRELGYDEEKIDRLYSLRVAHDFLPAIGSPAAFFHQPERPRDE